MALAWSGDHALADDLVQETLFKALQKRDQLREQDKMNAWLFSILSNCWREHLRRQRPTVPIEENQSVTWRCPERQHQEQQLVAWVRQGIAGLAPNDRQVLTLVDLEGMSYAETAEVLEVPIGTVMSRLSRARIKLRSMLGDMEGGGGTSRGRTPAHLRVIK
jgi:RNA polymerase sigma-70 factor (ECF subfamily)